VAGHHLRALALCAIMSAARLAATETDAKDSNGKGADNAAQQLADRIDELIAAKLKAGECGARASG
jgi:hypothetical protein